MIVRPASSDHFPWISSRAHLLPGYGFAMLEAVEDLHGAEGPDRVLGAVGFDAFTPSSVNLHIALDAPIALRGLIRQAFGIVFTQLRLKVAIVTVKSTNARSLALCRHLGFREVFRGRDYYDDGCDLVLMEMRARACRWLDRNPPTRTGHDARREAA